jgi:hypothetical protein
MKKVLWICVGLCMFAACASNNSSNQADVVATDGDISTDTATPIPEDVTTTLPVLHEALDCPTPAPNDNNTLPLKRILLSLEDHPSAQCNDGSPGAMYIREAANSESANRWFFHLQGGGGCGDYQTCLDRWCGNTASYDASRMSTNFGPLSRDGVGIMDREVENNPFADGNIVFVYYCSSDGHTGNQDDLTMTNPDDPTQSFRVHMRGHAILEAVVSTLMAGETTSDDESVTVPPLSEATQILFTGTSAGSSGAATHLDWFAEQVSPSTTVMGVFDASFHADISTIDDPVALANWDGFLEGMYTAGVPVNFFRDTSCQSMHSDEPELCADPIHVRLHHTTTPYFVRHDMGDPKAIAKIALLNEALEPEQIAAWNRDTLLLLPGLLETAEEKASMTRAPGVFSQACMQHVGLTNHNYVFAATIEDEGSETNLAQALARWIEGEEVALISELPPNSTSTCPPVSGELD